MSKQHPADYLETDDFIPLLQVIKRKLFMTIRFVTGFKFSNNKVNFAA